MTPRLRTAAVHAGDRPDPATGASSPNLVMSSTFVTRDPAGFSAHDLGDDSGFLYTRWSNPTVAQLEAKLCALEGAEACLCFGSGMAAAAGFLLSLLRSGDHVVMSDTTYAGVAELGRGTTSFRLRGAQLESYRKFAGDGIFRMSVGLEDPDDLCADLQRVLG